MNKEIAISNRDALILIDLQRDFFEDGILPVKGANEILGSLIPVIRLFPWIVASQDWHRIEKKTSQPEIFGQGHCIEKTPGAELHPILSNRMPDLIIQRDCKKEDETFSLFEQSELESWLRHRGIRRLFIAGFTSEYGVKETVLSGLKNGFELFVIRECIKPRGTEVDGARALKEMESAGAKLISEGQLVIADSYETRVSAGG